MSFVKNDADCSTRPMLIFCSTSEESIVAEQERIRPYSKAIGQQHRMFKKEYDFTGYCLIIYDAPAQSDVKIIDSSIYSSLPNTSLGQDNSLGWGKSENLGRDSSLGWEKEKT